VCVCVCVCLFFGCVWVFQKKILSLFKILDKVFFFSFFPTTQNIRNIYTLKLTLNNIESMNIKNSEIKETIIFIYFILVYIYENISFPFIISPFKIFIQSPQLGFMVNKRFDNWRACVFVCVVLCVYNNICIWRLATCYMFGDLYFEYLILLLYMMFYFYDVDNKQRWNVSSYSRHWPILELQIFNITLRCSLFAQPSIIKN